MPVILTEPEEWEAWITARVDAAKALQSPLPNDVLKIVAEGAQQDMGSLYIEVAVVEHSLEAATKVGK